MLPGRTTSLTTGWIHGGLSGKTAGRPTKKPACQPGDSALRSELMMVTFANSKGGVGKSTLAVHFAVWAFDQGIRTALIDTDKQRSSSAWIAEAEPGITIHTADTAEECLQQVTALRQTADLIVGDGPAGLDEISRTLLILSDLAILPLTPSLLDLRSVQQASEVLRFAQGINGGRPAGRIVLNKMRTRDSISRELQSAAPTLGVDVAETVIRDLQAYRDAAGQGDCVTRLGKKTRHAAQEVDALCRELLGDNLQQLIKHSHSQEAANG
jgi:chromosome partitioning protein